MKQNWEEIKNNDFAGFEWNETTNVYRAGASVPREKGSNGYVATNLGNTIVIVNGKTLFPSATPATAAGDSISSIGNRGEVFKGVIEIQFGAGATPVLELVQKFYTNYQ